MDEFFSNLECEIEKIRNDLKNIRPLEMTKEDRDRHRAADLCWVCDGPFRPYKDGDNARIMEGERPRPHYWGISRSGSFQM